MIENQLIRYLIIGIGLYLLYVYLNNQIYVERDEQISYKQIPELRDEIADDKPEEKMKVISKTKDYTNMWLKKGFGYGYGSMSPGGELPKLINELGPPNEFNGVSGGEAIWFKNSLGGTSYERIQIKDEQIPIDKPKPHTEFLYSWYRIKVPEWKVGGLDKISKSIEYNPKTNMIISRGHDLKCLAVNNWIVKYYAQGDLTIDEAVNMIGPMMLEIMDDKEGVKYRELENEL